MLGSGASSIGLWPTHAEAMQPEPSPPMTARCARYSRAPSRFRRRPLRSSASRLAGIGQPGVKPAEPPGRQGLPGQRRGSRLRQLLVQVPQIDRRDLFEFITLQRAAAVPDRLAAAAAILGSLPDDPNAPAESGLAVG